MWSLCDDRLFCRCREVRSFRVSLWQWTRKINREENARCVNERRSRWRFSGELTVEDIDWLWSCTVRRTGLFCKRAESQKELIELGRLLLCQGRRIFSRRSKNNNENDASIFVRSLLRIQLDGRWNLSVWNHFPSWSTRLGRSVFSRPAIIDRRESFATQFRAESKISP